MSKMKSEWEDEYFGEGYVYVAGDWSGSKPTDKLRDKDREREEAKQRHPSSGNYEFAKEEVDSFCLRFALYDIQDELADILISKHNDYGPKNISDAPGGALNGIRVRMHDKIARLNNLIDNNKEPKHESIRDTLVDIANYATIAMMVIDGVWDTE
jgi:hypothetical protein